MDMKSILAYPQGRSIVFGTFLSSLMDYRLSSLATEIPISGFVIESQINNSGSHLDD
jgi:hypothetical protein